MTRALLLVVGVLTANVAAGQTPVAAPQAMTLQDALRYANDHYPAVHAAVADVAVAQGNADAARGAYLPRLDGVWQSNRATANNIFGQLLPQSVIPALTGPVLPSPSGASVFGSAAGALLSWEPVDLGLRRATIDAVDAEVTRARAADTLTRLQVQAAVANAFLTAVAAEEEARTAHADVERRDVISRSVHVLVDNQLRPGADASRADAERAAAATRLIRAEADVRLARISLARTLGVPADSVVPQASALVAAPLPAEPPANHGQHPLLLEQQAEVDAARAQQLVLSRTDRPRLFVQGSVFARGSGAAPDGTFDGGLSGFGLDRANWAAGVQLQFPNVFDFTSLRARRAAAAAATASRAAHFDETALALGAERQRAAVLLEAARQVAGNTPVQLSAAQQSEAQARARYQAGLATLVDVSDAQTLLSQAESADALARLDVWRALLGDAVAAGDLAPFTALLTPAAGGR